MLDRRRGSKNNRKSLINNLASIFAVLKLMSVSYKEKEKGGKCLPFRFPKWDYYGDLSKKYETETTWLFTVSAGQALPTAAVV